MASATTATLLGLEVDAFGHTRAALHPVSRCSATLATAVHLSGYNVDDDRFCHLQADITVAWTVVRLPPAQRSGLTTFRQPRRRRNTPSSSTWTR